MPEADAEHGPLVHQRADRLDGLRVVLWVARAVGEHHAVAAVREDVARGRVRRVDAQRAAARLQAAQDAALEAEVHHRDAQRAALAPGGQVVGGLAGAARHLIVQHERARRLDVRLGRLARDDAPAQHAVHAHMPRQRAGVHAAKPGHALLVQIAVERLFAFPVARRVAQLRDHEALHIYAHALAVDRVDAHVSDQRVGHADDLPAVGRVGQRLLIAGHARGEDHLARHLGLAAEQRARVAGAVLQDQCSHPHSPFAICIVMRILGCFVGILPYIIRRQAFAVKRKESRQNGGINGTSFPRGAARWRPSEWGTRSAAPKIRHSGARFRAAPRNRGCRACRSSSRGGARRRACSARAWA